MKTLKDYPKIVLHRAENGWIVGDSDYLSNCRITCVFESTESLRDQLVELIGKSGWKVSVPQEIQELRKAAYEARDRVSGYSPEQKAELEKAARAKAHPMPPRGAGGKFLPKQPKDCGLVSDSKQDCTIPPSVDV